MALRNLTLPEMIGVSGGWLSEEGQRAVFERVPVWASLLPELARAHDALVRAERPSPNEKVAKEIGRLTTELIATDVVHDRHGRGGHWVLDGLIELAGADTDEGRRYAWLRSLAWPEGTAVNGQSYVAEAGVAERVHHALEEHKDLREGLKAIALPGKRTLLDVVKTQVEAGMKLGELEHRRMALVAQLSSGASIDDAPPSLGVARNGWMAVVGDVVRMAKYAPKDDLGVESALAVLRKTEEKADQRATKKPVEEEPPRG